MRTYRPPTAPGPRELTSSLRARLTTTDFRRSVLCAVLAVAALVTGSAVARNRDGQPELAAAVYGCALAALVFGVAGTRRLSAELARLGSIRAGASAGTAVRFGSLLAGYLITALAVLDLLDAQLGNLLVGGAVTGVIVGIAAQQTLGNLFAGLVLLFARPYVPGERIRILSGALGGPLDGTVTSVGLLYTNLRSADGPINIPNSGLLASAVETIPAGERRAAAPTSSTHGADQPPVSIC